MMRFLRGFAFVFWMSAAVSPGFAGQLHVTATRELKMSSDIFDDATDLADIGLHLRGVIDASDTTELGETTATGTFDLLSYRRYSFADARSAGFQLRQAFDAAGPLSVSADLGYSISDTGDDLVVSGLALALRQTIRSYSAGVTAKLSLPHDLVAALSIANRYDDVGKARFVAPLPDTKINPDIDDLTGSLALAGTRGALQYAVVAKLEKVNLFEQSVFQNAVPFSRYDLRTRLIGTGPGGWKATADFGLAHLRDAYGLYDAARPVYLAELERRFGARLDVTGRLQCDFDTADTDDPLATYKRRLELEATLTAGEKTLLGAGVYAARGPNLLLGTTEREWGGYGALSYRPTAAISFLARVDYKKVREEVANDDRNVWTARIGMQSKL